MKKMLIVALVIIALGAGGVFLFKDRLFGKTPEQAVLQQTYDLSKEYILLRYRTDNILINAREYTDHSVWDEEMSRLIADWGEFEQDSLQLEESATEIAEMAVVDFNLIKVASAYDSAEVQRIIESAPMGKQIRTLASHFGVDAKRAQLILNQSQDKISSEVWAGEGNELENLENTAIVIKDGCKVAGFVGTVVLTGGAAGGFAAAGTMTKVGIVVAGADLALEVTEDSAQIAFGDKNKVSNLMKDIRTVTEPVASVLAITNIHSNLGTAYGKIDAVFIGLEQFRDTVQEGKVVGVDLSKFKYQKPFQRIRQAKYPETVTVAEMEMAEVETWLQSLNKKYEPMTEAEVKEFLESTGNAAEKEDVVEKKEDASKTEENNRITESPTADIPNQIIKVVNVSSSSYMIDSCYSPTCWDDLNANPAEDLDLGGIYTLGKVFANGESFRTGFRPPELKASGKLKETSANSYKITIYLAIAPFEGPKHKTIDYGTWENHSIEVEANYGDEPVVEWDGSTLRQVD